MDFVETYNSIFSFHIHNFVQKILSSLRCRQARAYFVAGEDMLLFTNTARIARMLVNM